MSALDVVGGVLLVAGAAFVLIGAVGVVRFHASVERLHAAAKGPTLGLMLLGAGTACTIRSSSAVAGVALVIVLQLVAGPIGSHMIGRAIHRADARLHGRPGSDDGDPIAGDVRPG